MKFLGTPLAGLTLVPVMVTCGMRLVTFVPAGTVRAMLVPLIAPFTPLIVN